jgi:hypothetical protein
MKRFLPGFIILFFIFFSVLTGFFNSVSAQSCGCGGSSYCPSIPDETNCKAATNCVWNGPCTTQTCGCGGSGYCPNITDETNCKAATGGCTWYGSCSTTTTAPPPPGGGSSGWVDPGNYSGTNVSNCVLTKVGNPQGTPPVCYGITYDPNNPFMPIDGTIIDFGSANHELVKSAIGMYNAYVSCGRPSRFTGDLPGVKDCLFSKLLSYGYDSAAANRGVLYRSLTGAPSGAPNVNVACSQCVGFVNSSAAIIETGGFGSVTCAGNILRLYPVAFPIGSSIYGKLGAGNAVNILPGDIGVSGNYGCGDGLGYGHILVVKDVVSATSFTGLESNWGNDCLVYGNVVHLKEKYHFYRKY